MAEVFKRLTGDVDGVNTTYATPTNYVAGTFRLVLNGVVYESDHPAFGFTETPPDQVELDVAPLTGEEVTGFYTELVADGSPFHPTGLYP
jgi:hypothetical protein